MDDGLNFLTDKDLDYFQELEKRGEAVILKISDEELLSLDFSETVKSAETPEPINQTELEQWVKSYKKEFLRLYKENQKVTQDNELMKECIKEGKAENDGLSMQDVPELPAQRKKKKSKDSESGEAAEEWLLQAGQDPERTGIIRDAVANGLDDRMIHLLLQDELSVDEMKKLYLVFTGDIKNS